MNVIKIFINAYIVKHLDCKDIIDYTSRYQIIFDKIFSLINKNLEISKKTIKIML